MQAIKLGIIGLGKAWERLHAPALAQLTDKFVITAICDSDPDKAHQAASWMGLAHSSVYYDYDKMLVEADIEAVDIMLPITENFECARAAIIRGKHLVAEKPLAATLESARELIRLKKRSEVIMLVAENSRYEEENQIIKQLLDEGRIGNPVYFIDNHVIQFQKDMTDSGNFAASQWRRDADFKGGVFLDTGIHHVARQRFLFGDVRFLYATGRPSEAEFAPYSALHALLTFDGYLTGQYNFFITGAETQSPAVGLRIFGTEGEIYLENKDCGFVNVSRKESAVSGAGRSASWPNTCTHEVIPYTPNAGYRQELINFYEALRNKKEITSTPEKAIGDMEVIFNMLESANNLSDLSNKHPA